MQQRLKLQQQQQQQALMQQALLQQQQMYHHPGMLAAAAMTQVRTQSSFPFRSSLRGPPIVPSTHF